MKLLSTFTAALLASTAMASAQGVAPPINPATGQALVPTPQNYQAMINALPWVNGMGKLTGSTFRDNYQALHDVLATTGKWPAAGGFVPNVVGKIMAAGYLTDLTGATDQTAQMNAAIFAAGNGGHIEWPAGVIAYGAGGVGLVTLPGQVWECMGSSFGDSSQYGSPTATAGGTTFRFNQNSGVALKLVGSGAAARHCSFTNSVAGTQANGVQLGDSSGPSNTASGNPESQSLDDVRFEGFATQIDVQSGEFWRISRFDLHGALGYALRVRNAFNGDSGDGSLLAGTIYPSNTGEGIRYESGGGFKMSHTKILGGAYAFDLAIADGVTTSDLFIDDTNSFEGQLVGSVTMGAGGPSLSGIMGNIVLDAQIANFPGTGAPAVTATSAAVTLNKGVVGAFVGGIYGTVFNPIIVNGAVQTRIVPRLMGNVSGAGVTLQPSAALVNLDARFPFSGPGYALQDNRPAAPTGTSFDGIVTRQYANSLNLAQPTSAQLSASGAGTAAQGYSQFLYIGIPAFTSAHVKVFAQGITQGVGAVNAYSEIIATNTGGGVATPTVVNSKSSGGAIDVGYDVVTSPGGLRIGIRPNANGNGAAGNLQGSITIDVDGKTSTFQALQ